jgi:glucose-6-phosphate isomerase
MPSVEQLTARIGQRNEQPAWQALAGLAADRSGLTLASLLSDSDRSERYTAQLEDLYLDFSRNLLSDPILEGLFTLADACELAAWRDALFAGEPVNTTERRAALHMALRGQADDQYAVAGENVMPEVLRERERMLDFADAVRAGRYRGHAGAPITDIVNIGIGGSDLGLVMVTEALKPLQADSLRLHFVSNVDGTELGDVLGKVEPARTLFVICSKSFTTLETQLNAQAARDWFVAQMPEEAVGRHFVAVSVNAQAMDVFGIDPRNRFRIWDWVGGRYSLWSSIGLSIAIAIGREAFLELLAGGASMDAHFRVAPAEQNLPILLGLIGVWNQNFLGVHSHAVLPYAQRLHRLPAFLQQLDMESNGKSVTRGGNPVNWSTGTIIWGEPGSNAQHSFFQLLHQGTAHVSLDLIAVCRGGLRAEQQHQALANLLAQAEAFARGRDAKAVQKELSQAGLSAERIAELLPHKLHPGGRASNLLVVKELTPRTLGQIIALYEHKVFVQSVIWGINAFDQWGVELGKRMAGEFATALDARDLGQLPPVAKQILKWSQR